LALSTDLSLPAVAYRERCHRPSDHGRAGDPATLPGCGASSARSIRRRSA